MAHYIAVTDVRRIGWRREPNRTAPVRFGVICRWEPKVRFPSSAPEFGCVNERPEWGMKSGSRRQG